MLSKKAKYALKGLLVLAKEYGQGPVHISEIARREGIPGKFLELILLELKNQGVVHSKRGASGGYFLAHPPRKIYVGQIVRVLDGPLAPLPCVSHTAYMRCRECRDEKTCGIRLVMKQVRDATARILDAKSLADVLRGVDGTASRKESSRTLRLRKQGIHSNLMEIGRIGPCD